MKLKQAFGIALKRQRVRKGLSQEEFSDVSSRTYLSSLERGLKSPTIDKVDDLAKTMNIHALSLLAQAYLEQDTELTIEMLISRLREEVFTENFEQPRSARQAKPKSSRS